MLCNIYEQSNKSEEQQNLNKIIKELDDISWGEK